MENPSFQPSLGPSQYKCRLIRRRGFEEGGKSSHSVNETYLSKKRLVSKSLKMSEYEKIKKFYADPRKGRPTQTRITLVLYFVTILGRRNTPLLSITNFLFGREVEVSIWRVSRNTPTNFVQEWITEENSRL